MGRKYSRARMTSVGGGILSPLLSCGRLAFGCGSPSIHVVASPSAAAPPALLRFTLADGELDPALGCGVGGLLGRAHRQPLVLDALGLDEPLLGGGDAFVLELLDLGLGHLLALAKELQLLLACRRQFL